MTDFYKGFEKEMDNLSRRYDAPRVFDDFLTVAQCALHQTNIASCLQEKDEENEALYFETIKSYTKDELHQFAKLLGYVQSSVHAAPYSDLLGRYFTLEITRGRQGQYFTPDGVAELIAGVIGADEAPPVGKSVYDPACGSGRLCLHFAAVAPKNRFFGNDVSLTCARIASINFMLNGLVGEVACMNTLSMEWFQGWKINTPTLGIRLIEKEESQIWSAPPPVQAPDLPEHPKVKPGGPQLRLF